MTPMNKRNADFIDEFYMLQESEGLDSRNLSVYDGGKSKIDKAITNLELEHDIIRKQWMQLIQAYEKLGLTSEAIDKVKKLVKIADARATVTPSMEEPNV